MKTPNIEYRKKQSDDLLTVEALCEEQVVGFANYKIIKGQAWLYMIKVADNFRKYGIGTNLIRIMEDDCANRRVDFIEGKYYPEGAEDSEVRRFYNKNGFDIYKDGYETMVGKYSLESQDLHGISIKSDPDLEK